jgi:hypothetical protein
MVEQDAAIASGAQALKQTSETICERIYALLQQVHRDNDHNPYVGAIMSLADPLIDAAGSFAIYISALGERLMAHEYADALNVGRLLIQHEAMLLAVADGHRPHGAQLNS